MYTHGFTPVLYYPVTEDYCNNEKDFLKMRSIGHIISFRYYLFNLIYAELFLLRNSKLNDNYWLCFLKGVFPRLMYTPWL